MKYNTQNLNKLFDSNNNWGIPNVLTPKVDILPNKLIAYGNTKTKDQCYHFFIKDYKFEALWSLNKNTLRSLKRQQVILAPVYNISADLPLVARIWNVYRSRWLTRLWQENGINVIPTATWNDEESLKFAFEGLPVNSIIAITVRDHTEESFKLGLEALINKCNPKQLLIYGESSSPLFNVALKMHSNVKIYTFNKLK